MTDIKYAVPKMRELTGAEISRVTRGDQSVEVVEDDSSIPFTIPSGFLAYFSFLFPQFSLKGL